jgi:hypothetical protein
MEREKEREKTMTSKQINKEFMSMIHAISIAQTLLIGQESKHPKGWRQQIENGRQAWIRMASEIEYQADMKEIAYNAKQRKVLP